jgi:hypothetical protein
LWAQWDEVVVRVERLGATGNDKTDSVVQAAVADPGGGHVAVSFGGVACQVTALRQKSDSVTYTDVACTLGEVPGGLVHHPVVEVQSLGFSMDSKTFLSTPLSITSITRADGAPIGESTLGGGWNLSVQGVGFGSASSEADIAVEVTVCGKQCVVVSGTYNSVQCVVPNVSTPEVADGRVDDMVLPPARLLSQGAGLASTIGPRCFHGIDGSLEYGHPACVSVFDGDAEVTGGLTGSGCYVGLDFGAETDVRIERFRFHPLYDPLDAPRLVNTYFEVGVLQEPQSCDELSYGWRGDAYVGCQEVAVTGARCLPW